MLLELLLSKKDLVEFSRIQIQIYKEQCRHVKYESRIIIIDIPDVLQVALKQL